jgi:aspartate kinase
MAYYGAQVIHPKTIKPLQNKNIPLFVRSFLDLRLTGTVISNDSVNNLPPVIVFKRKQVLVTLQSTDFSFVEGKPALFLNELLERVRLKPNLTQNTAITLMVCVDDIAEKVERLALIASEMFDVQVQKNLELLTIRHYTPEIIESLSGNRNIILEQKTKETIQLLMENI